MASCMESPGFSTSSASSAKHKPGTSSRHVSRRASKNDTCRFLFILLPPKPLLIKNNHNNACLFYDNYGGKHNNIFILLYWNLNSFFFPKLMKKNPDKLRKL